MDWTMSLMGMNIGIFDLIVFGAIIIGGVTGGSLGFTRSACKILGYLVAFPLALLFVHPISGFILSKIAMPAFVSSLISYLVAAAVIYVLFRLLGNLLFSFFDALGLSMLDHILGCFWGIVIGVAAVFLILEVLSIQEFISFVPLKENSILYHDIYMKVFPTAAAKLKGAVIGIK